MQEMVRRPGGAEPDAPVMDANRAAIALATAMNEARAGLAGSEEAARSGRTAVLDRLEALRRRLAPLYAAIPRDVEGFDLGLVKPEHPRLFVDMIAWVEAGKQGRGWRFLQETRGGRRVLLETDDEPALIDEITRYLARRLVARERSLSLEEGMPAAFPRRPPAAAAPPMEKDDRSLSPSSVAAPSAAASEMPAAGAESPPTEKVEPSWRRTALRDPAAPAASTAAAPAPAASGRMHGWWLWPLFALIIGLGLGALALYLYARTMAR